MEWKHQKWLAERAVKLDLETFLGGMETRLDTVLAHGPDLPLKPSLVEWKPVTATAIGGAIAP